MNLKYMLPLSIFEAIERAGMATTRQIITLSIWDIKKYTNLSTGDILLAKNIIASNVSPRIVSCDNKRKENCQITPIAFGCTNIDELLNGGIRRGTITEVFGESGCGKTQLTLQMILNNWMNGSVYICTEDFFPSKRFEEMKQALHTYDQSIDYGKTIYVEHLTEPNDLLSCISVRLPKLLAQNNLSVVIIDSIAAPFRCESTNYIKRAEDLREIAVLLTKLAQKHNLAVLCINQVTASFDDTDNVLPSLGLAWSNMVTTRLRVKKTKKVLEDTKYQTLFTINYVRELSVVFAPDLPNAVTEFIITSRGVQALEC